MLNGSRRALVCGGLALLVACSEDSSGAPGAAGNAGQATGGSASGGSAGKGAAGSLAAGKGGSAASAGQGGAGGKSAGQGGVMSGGGGQGPAAGQGGSAGTGDAGSAGTSQGGGAGGSEAAGAGGSEAAGAGGSEAAGAGGEPGGAGGEGGGEPGGAAGEPDCGPSVTSGGTLDQPELRAVEFANIPLENVVAGPSGYHIGLDLILSGDYVPGHHSEDPFYWANVMAHVGPISYYRVEGPGSYPYGVFINNKDPNACAQCAPGAACRAWCNVCQPDYEHRWANRLTAVALEIYSHDSEWGSGRFQVNSFDNFANGGVYSNNPGTITLPRLGDPGVAKVNGFVWRTEGVAVSQDEVGVDVFCQGPPALSSTGVEFYGFGSTSTNQDGYYNPGPMSFGSWKVYLTDRTNNKQVITYWNVTDVDTRIDVRLDLPCFGFPSCE